jgi:hypothetical protein
MLLVMLEAFLCYLRVLFSMSHLLTTAGSCLKASTSAVVAIAALTGLGVTINSVPAHMCLHRISSRGRSLCCTCYLLQWVCW